MMLWEVTPFIVFKVVIYCISSMHNFMVIWVQFTVWGYVIYIWEFTYPGKQVKEKVLKNVDLNGRTRDPLWCIRPTFSAMVNRGSTDWETEQFHNPGGLMTLAILWTSLMTLTWKERLWWNFTLQEIIVLPMALLKDLLIERVCR